MEVEKLRSTDQLRFNAWIKASPTKHKIVRQPVLTWTQWTVLDVGDNSQFHQWGIKKQVPKDEYFCVHLGKDSTTLCRWFVLSTLCVLSVLCYINIKKRPVEQLEGVFFIVRRSLHYQIRPGILKFSVHILIALLVPVYLCTKIPL